MAAGGHPVTEPIRWLSTKDAAELLGVTLRSLYRFIDEGDLVAYKFGRVIRIQEPDVEKFIAASRITPGSLEHLYPEIKGNSEANGNGNGNGKAHVTPDGLSSVED
jgi:excisionase family DNA binding protein